MPSSNLQEEATLIVACIDWRVTEYSREIERSLPPGSCFTQRFAGGGSKILTSETAADEFMDTMEILMDAASRPLIIKVLLLNHTGICRGLQRQYGSDCDIQAKDTLPLARKKVIGLLEKEWPDYKGFVIDTGCVELPVLSSGSAGQPPKAPASAGSEKDKAA